MIQEITFLNQKKIVISSQELVMLLVVIILNIKVVEIKAKYYLLKAIFM